MQDPKSTSLDLLPKKGVTVRRVVISADTKAAVKMFTQDIDDYVFNISADALEHRLTRYYRKLGKHVTTHDLRKSKATHLHNVNKWSLLRISKYLGHSSV